MENTQPNALAASLKTTGHSVSDEQLQLLLKDYDLTQQYIARWMDSSFRFGIGPWYPARRLWPTPSHSTRGGFSLAMSSSFWRSFFSN